MEAPRQHGQWTQATLKSLPGLCPPYTGPSPPEVCQRALLGWPGTDRNPPRADCVSVLCMDKPWPTSVDSGSFSAGSSVSFLITAGSSVCFARMQGWLKADWYWPAARADSLCAAPASSGCAQRTSAAISPTRHFGRGFLVPGSAGAVRDGGGLLGHS